jgi:hypothetical protein
MNQSRLPKIALIAVALMAAAAAIAITALPGTAQSQTGRTFIVLQKDGEVTFVDAPPRRGVQKPPSRGDSYYTINTILDPTTRRTRGRVHSACATTVPGRRAVALCSNALVLKDGTIVLQGTFPFTADRVTLAVTGGTGAYAGTTGTATFVSGKGEFATYEIRLRD